jgi:hypothetical protein
VGISVMTGRLGTAGFSFLYSMIFQKVICEVIYD